MYIEYHLPTTKDKAIFDLDVLRKHDNNAIFLAENMVFKTDYPLSENSIKRLCGIINYCDEKFLDGLNVYYAIAPDKNYYLESTNHLILDYSAMADLVRTGINDDIKYIDLFGALSLDSFYLTDSHWRQDRLGGVISAISGGMGTKIPFDASMYKQKRYSPFYGVFYGQSALNIAPDEIVYLVSDKTENAVVTSLEKPGSVFTVYDETALGGMDSYNLFMLGPAAVVTAENAEKGTGRGIVIFRDSFSSSLAPLLLEGYDTVTLIDLRYIRPDLLGDEGIMGGFVDFTDKDVLFMYSSAIFNNSDSIRNAQSEEFVSPFVAMSSVE
jgi:hypothetical protein